MLVPPLPKVTSSILGIPFLVSMTNDDYRAPNSGVLTRAGNEREILSKHLLSRTSFTVWILSALDSGIMAYGAIEQSIMLHAQRLCAESLGRSVIAPLACSVTPCISEELSPPQPPLRPPPISMKAGYLSQPRHLPFWRSAVLGLIRSAVGLNASPYWHFALESGESRAGFLHCPTPLRPPAARQQLPVVAPRSHAQRSRFLRRAWVCASSHCFIV